MAVAAITANSTARWLSTGSAPGNPRQVAQTCVLGSPPNLFAQPQKAFVFVNSCTWTSRPMTGSYLASTSGKTFIADTVIVIHTNNDLHTRFPRFASEIAREVPFDD